MIRASTRAALLALAATLAACGGGGDLCLLDIVGPPTAAEQDLPLCGADGRVVIPQPNCTTNPERCA